MAYTVNYTAVLCISVQCCSFSTILMLLYRMLSLLCLYSSSTVLLICIYILVVVLASLYYTLTHVSVIVHTHTHTLTHEADIWLFAFIIRSCQRYVCTVGWSGPAKRRRRPIESGPVKTGNIHAPSPSNHPYPQCLELIYICVYIHTVLTSAIKSTNCFCFLVIIFWQSYRTEEDIVNNICFFIYCLQEFY